jgi:hypothetical protein
MEIYNHQNLSKNSNYINDLIGKEKKATSSAAFALPL